MQRNVGNHKSTRTRTIAVVIVIAVAVVVVIAITIIVTASTVEKLMNKKHSSRIKSNRNKRNINNPK